MSLLGGEFLLFSQTMLLMAVALYGIPHVNAIAPGVAWKSKRGGRLLWGVFHLLRAVIVGGIATLLAQEHSSWLLGEAMLVVCVLVSGMRAMMPLKFRAEVELGTVGLVVVVAYWVISATRLTAHWATTMSPISGGNGAVWLVSLSILIALMQGGTFIVRGVLERGGAMPPRQTESPQLVFQHGRMIGMVERLILAILVANGQYAAVAFFFAGKGLIRSKELDLRESADYLLLGSLMSFLVALVAGLVIGKLFVG